METLGAAATQLGAYMQQNRLDKRHQSGDEDPVSETEMSRDGDSPDTLSRVPPSDVDPDTLDKLRRQEREEREEIEKELRAQDNNVNKGGVPPLPLGLEGLEAFRRQYLASPLSNLTRMPPGFPGLIPPPPPIPQTPPERVLQETSYKSSSANTPNSSQHSTPSSEFSSQQNWSFEEQFKQGASLGEAGVAESLPIPLLFNHRQQIDDFFIKGLHCEALRMNDDPKRKEFLDDLFSFMQKRGTPINRLPIMAKQVLDLYELYNLVCARGGLVEVINKKQWQEIIKGLNLPSSITSAAFTLRTQYTKYIYPYECENKKLSHPNELQCAIEGNRREGRRSGYESYNMFSPPHHNNRSPSMPLPPTSLGPHLSASMRPNFNGSMFPGSLGMELRMIILIINKKNQQFFLSRKSGGKSSPPSGGSPLNALEMTRLALFKMYNQAGAAGLPGHAGLSHPAMPPFIPEQISAPPHNSNSGIGGGGHDHVSRRKSADESRRSPLRVAAPRDEDEDQHNHHSSSSHHPQLHRSHSSRMDEDRTTAAEDSRVSPPPVKRERTEASVDTRQSPPVGGGSGSVGGANIKIANRGDNSDSSLVVSLEINSVMYQGVLFAQPKSSNDNSERKESQISE
ncbi:Protein dead ringer,AT-rich interactive domain-containing protein 3A,AT-rich interactive domain-containing protein 3B,Protein dead ringer homolog,AT-rich interactive domain-containing protein 3C [Lepeophtheirus salmonis]|uniref:Protein dead ringer,AT-rich interactive domain-containing protein 3A,AT-rich interactive domain-containing protein 3B,Protein dead ringer homolog,AT-rich interactive domain-containing protein 3C n=2 Tax=Lepeophtheirus salmonis TaxID=72036 RepID=A0A7R8CJB8_LEPSM|nr:Protein dead ringer,AT-rich interactive domain-containing protein 3A,AT-rich interactive domain-containing protein 3B,Protein dead ringer homolog,AT-rich interactive domain-containing protein 3C [Lepeophtheirus salmonis]CAF2839923.1 Protein dead ringer,AT-rich interactive domain-containing protein 3A,AT-rich interactive domain-containing protein 3B,Protein dead ringer homolog,AT-rich interactive domain-containing protein 3C [Lepeophtheirus salmonis]